MLRQDTQNHQVDAYTDTHHVVVVLRWPRVTGKRREAGLAVVDGAASGGARLLPHMA